MGEQGGGPTGGTLTGGTLTGRVALVAGATRGAGRGIATQLGAAGATVYVTGRSGGGQRSEYDRPETIEETAELVTAAGGRGIPVRVDHLEAEQVSDLVARIDREAGRLDVLVWPADAPPRRRHTDGTAEYNADTYRVSTFYDLAKASVIRMAWALAHELRPHRATSVALTPGWLRSEIMLDTFKVTEDNWRDALAEQPHFCISESPAFVGRAVAALAADPEVSRWSGRSLSSGQLAKEYGFTDLDGSRPDAWRYLPEVQDAGRPADAAGYR
jgi:NAD(P)-dependent dehydrogenase (short-subunit alcohol dehydrogenase family)